MGVATEEKGVLKLVHPGRYVEIHKEPIIAAEVLKRNPRHSVTRPDVFEYPWVVVKPESVLTLGKVFFIVPNHTIYDLLKAHRERHQQYPQRSQSPKNPVEQPVQKLNLMRNSAGMTTKRLNYHLWLKQSLTMTSCIGIPLQEKDSGKKLRNQSKVASWPRLKDKDIRLELKEKSLEVSTSANRSCNQKEHQLDNSITVDYTKKNEGDLEAKCREQATMVKSCLRKEDSVRKLLHLKVSFALTTKDEEQQRGVKLSPAEFAGRSCRDFFVHSTQLVPT